MILSQFYFHLATLFFSCRCSGRKGKEPSSLADGGRVIDQTQLFRFFRVRQEAAAGEREHAGKKEENLVLRRPAYRAF
jgi:hypothetical protein